MFFPIFSLFFAFLIRFPCFRVAVGVRRSSVVGPHRIPSAMLFEKHVLILLSGRWTFGTTRTTTSLSSRLFCSLAICAPAGDVVVHAFDVLICYPRYLQIHNDDASVLFRAASFLQKHPCFTDSAWFPPWCFLFITSLSFVTCHCALLLALCYCFRICRRVSS